MSSSLKPLDQFHQFTCLSKGYCQFVQVVPCHWTRWPPCPCIVKTLKNLLLQNQESFAVESWCIASGTQSTKFVKMMIVGWALFFLLQSQICVPIHLYGENVEKNHFSHYVLKTNGWNLQRMIKEVKLFSYHQNFEDYLPLALSYVHV